MAGGWWLVISGRFAPDLSCCGQMLKGDGSDRTLRPTETFDCAKAFSRGEGGAAPEQYGYLYGDALS